MIGRILKDELVIVSVFLPALERDHMLASAGSLKKKANLGVTTLWDNESRERSYQAICRKRRLA